MFWLKEESNRERSKRKRRQEKGKRGESRREERLGDNSRGENREERRNETKTKHELFFGTLYFQKFLGHNRVPWAAVTRLFQKLRD